MADGAPSSDPQGSPPSGNVSSTATCCPEVSTFDGSRNAAVFGGLMRAPIWWKIAIPMNTGSRRTRGNRPPAI